MKNLLQKIFIINIFIFPLYANILELDKDMKGLDEELSCLNQQTKNNKIECLKERVEKNINENYNVGSIQLFVFSQKKKKLAEKEVLKYNSWKKTKENLKNSKADYFLKEFKGHKKLKDGKYYVVYVEEKGVDAKKLQKKIGILHYPKIP